MGVISPILLKEFDKFHNTSELMGQAPGSSQQCTVIGEECIYTAKAGQAKCSHNSQRKCQNSLSFAQIKKCQKRSCLIHMRKFNITNLTPSIGSSCFETLKKELSLYVIFIMMDIVES